AGVAALALVGVVALRWTSEPVGAIEPSPAPAIAAADRAPPSATVAPTARMITIDHEPPASACAAPLEFQARASGANDEDVLSLHWRRAGTEAFARSAFTGEDGSLRAQLTPEDHGDATVEYYLQLTGAGGQVLAARGDEAALMRVPQDCPQGKEHPAAAYRRWCFVNSNMNGRKKCWPSRAACVKDATEWLGPEGKGRCRGER
ncbi:MAG: hypothetical protein KC636_15050, partial [Myxococcales bacterium]|nr:hypothetical protein [Myxococcales bacterium]